MPPRDLTIRTQRFALAVRNFVRLLPHTDEARETGGQLRRAANSMRSNYRASRRGRSRKEFQSKLGTVFEEADECVDHLQYLSDAHIRHDAALLQQARELARIFAKSVSTARKNTERMKGIRRVNCLASQLVASSQLLYLSTYFSTSSTLSTYLLSQ